MDRLNLSDEQVEAKRQEQLDANANLTGTWDPEDDPNRTGDICAGSPLKLYDDVQIRGGRGYRVVAPAEGRTRFSVFGLGDFGWTLMSADLSEVTDRAPADPNETPMPVLPSEPTPEPEP